MIARRELSAQPNWNADNSTDGGKRQFSGVGFWSVLTVVVTATIAAMARPGIRTDWFFDEVWRVDMIRSGWNFDRYFQHSTPLPPGWLVINWAIFEVLPQGREILRLSALAPAVLSWLMIADIFRRRLQPQFGRIQAHAMSFIAVSFALLLPGQAQLVTFFNNYSFDLLLAVGFLRAFVQLQDNRTRSSAVTISILLIVTPFVAQSPLFMAVPVTLGALWVVDHCERRILFIAAGIGVVVLLSTYFLFLRPVSIRQIPGAVSINEYWKSESLRSFNPYTAARFWLRSMSDAVIPIAWRNSLGGWVYFAGGFLAGVICIWRTFKFWFVAAGISQVLIALASLTLSWPIGFGRLNTAVGFLFTFLVPLGAAFCIVRLASLISRHGFGRERIRMMLGSCFALTLGLVFVAGAWPSEIRSSAANTVVFARGLSRDLDQLEKWSKDGDVVLGFHFMSSWYTHDRLTTDGDLDLVILDELKYGERLVIDPMGVLEEYSPHASTVWCVLPFELGPEGIAQRCNLNDGSWQLVESTRLVRAEIRLWKRR